MRLAGEIAATRDWNATIVMSSSSFSFFFLSLRSRPIQNIGFFSHLHLEYISESEYFECRYTYTAPNSSAPTTIIASSIQN